MASTAAAIDAELLAILQAAGLTKADGSAIAATAFVIRMLPKDGEVIDPVPCVVIAPKDGIPSQPNGTEGSTGRTYSREVCLIDGIEDFATNQSLYEEWHETLRNTIERTADGYFRVKLDSVPTVWSIEIQDAPTFDRSKLAKNYAYQSILVTVRTSE